MSTFRELQATLYYKEWEQDQTRENADMVVRRFGLSNIDQNILSLWVNDAWNQMDVIRAVSDAEKRKFSLKGRIEASSKRLNRAGRSPLFRARRTSAT